MDDGLPIAYSLLGSGVPVYTREGDEIGTVHHVVSAPQQDIFHGLVLATTRLGKRFVPAEDIASLHERGVELRIGREDISELPVPGGAAPAFREDAAMSSWGHWARRLSGRGDWDKEK